MKEAVKIFCAFKGQNKKHKAISIARLGNSEKGRGVTSGLEEH